MAVIKKRFFCVKDFEKLQHYKNRNPQWVKLYYQILDDKDFISLQIESRHHLVMLFLVASRCGNVIPLDPKFLKKVMRLDDEPVLTELFKKGFLLALNKRDAGKRMANRRQNALSEAEKKREEKESESELETNQNFEGFSLSFEENTRKEEGRKRGKDNSLHDGNSSLVNTKNDSGFDPPPSYSDVKRFIGILRSSGGRGSEGFTSATQGLESGHHASGGLKGACRRRVEIGGRLKFCGAVAVQGVGERARCVACVAQSQARMEKLANE